MVLRVDYSDVKAHYLAGEIPISGGEADIHRLDIDAGNRLSSLTTTTTAERRIAEEGLYGITPILFKEYQFRNHILAYEIPQGLHLDRLINLWHRFSKDSRDILASLSAWPIASVYDGTRFKGFLMRDIKLDHTGRPASKIRWNGNDCITAGKLSPWFQSADQLAKHRLKHYVPLNLQGKVSIIESMLTYYQLMHDSGLIIGDISPTNILAYVPDPHDQAMGLARPRFIEIDTYRFADSVPAMPQAHTGGWEPPEWHEGMLQTKQTDVYKVGLLILRLMDEQEYSLTESYEDNARRDEVCQTLTSKFSPRFASLVRHAVGDDADDRPSMAELHLAFMQRSM